MTIWTRVFIGVVVSALCVSRFAMAQVPKPSAASGCVMQRPPEERILACREALSADSLNVRARDRLAAALAQQGRFPEALREWKRVIQLSPNEYTAHHNAGLMLEALERFAESLPMFERALTLTTDHVALQTTRWHVGVGQDNLGRLEEALKSFREAARLNPNDPLSWSHAAIVTARLEHHAEAVSYWERTLQVDPRYFERVQPGERRLYEKSVKIAGPQQPAPVDTSRASPLRREPR